MVCNFFICQVTYVLDLDRGFFCLSIHGLAYCMSNFDLIIYLNGALPILATAMASSFPFTHLFPLNAVGRHSLVFFPSNRAIKFQGAQIKGLPERMLNEKMVKSRQYRLAPSLAMGNSDISIDSSSPSHVIREFYSYINQKNLKQLGKLLSDDCFFEDYSFPNPFEGKHEVLRFLEQLTISMGQNVEFNVEHYCVGDGYTVTVNWHLDWKKKQVPFTRGSSYYELSRNRERFVIKKIQVVIESPLKPGGLALAFFKIITSIFDAFPDGAERFLKSPHLIISLLLKLYHMVLEPILKPILAWHVRLWSFVLNVLSFTLNILYYIAKIFNK